MLLEPYEYADTDQVQCPKCGQLSKIALASNTGRSLEYAGVCQSTLGPESRCGTVLRLQVVAHLFPVQSRQRR